MGTQHGGNGDNVPPDGDRSHEPELPAGWGDIEIPDDLSELAEEAEQIRQELARERREGRSRKKPASPTGGSNEPSIGVPLLIMSVAVIITLVSLFAMTWSGSNTITPDDASTVAPAQLPAMTLTDEGGERVSLADRVPIVIMLIEECDCGALLADTVAAAPPGVTVAAIDQQAPARPSGLAGDDPDPLLLGDPTGRVRAQLDLGPPTDAATVVLVNQDGQITRTHDAVTSLAQFQPGLTNLAPA